MRTIIKYFPFAAIIALYVFVSRSGFSMPSVQPVVLTFTLLIAINFVLALILKIKNYFLSGISGVAFAGAASVLFWPENPGRFYTENILAFMYFGLFIVTAFPPLFGFKPFTFEFSAKKYPLVVIRSNQFLNVNLIINYIWAFLFAFAIFLTVIRYHPDDTINTLTATLVSVVFLLAAGIPLTLRMPGYLMQKVGGKKVKFRCIKDLFEAMPYGLNKKEARGINTVIQFYLTGTEPTTGYLTIDDQKCFYTEGEHLNPKTIIRSDAGLWLAISNNDVSGDIAYINNQFEIEGDATILLKLHRLFSPPSKDGPETKNNAGINYDYKTFSAGKIRNIVVFDGGYRTPKFSKTLFMADNFIEGAKEAGANVEYFKLKDYNIKDCTGCYSCWTKTPGECSIKDDMKLLLDKYRCANLVVFASPLYVFSVTGMMKTFLDRFLPVIKPYMLINKEGITIHPDRYPEKGEQGFVVVSAAGFPEVEHNFDGLTGLFRVFNARNENIHLAGEFLLPAAEFITQPIYANRRALIAHACRESGKQIVKEGRIDKKYMQTVQDPGVTKKVFQQQANAFWDTMVNKTFYMNTAPLIPEKD